MLRIINQLISKVYWSIQNKVSHKFVDSNLVSVKAQIGRYCWIRQGAEICSKVEIGDYSYIIGPNTYIEEAVIGKFCSIARNVVIGPFDHNYNWLSTHPFIFSKFYGFIKRDKTRPQKNATVIGNDVWVGTKSVILRGVKVGHGAVIAAGCVVTHDVDSYSIVAGVPARHIKYRFPRQVRDALLEMKWWDWSQEQLKEAVPLFYDVKALIGKYHKGMFVHTKGASIKSRLNDIKVAAHQHK